MSQLVQSALDGYKVCACILSASAISLLSLHTCNTCRVWVERIWVGLPGSWPFELPFDIMERCLLLARATRTP